MRIAMLSDISFILSLSEPVITVFDLALSWRDIVLGVGGFFLLTKGTREIHAEVEGFHERLGTAKASYAGVIMQIVVWTSSFPSIPSSPPSTLPNIW